MWQMRAGVWGGIAVLLFSVGSLVYSLSYRYSSTFGFGPGFLPTWLSIILLILSVLYIIEAARGVNAAEGSIPRGRDLVYVLLVLGALVVYPALLTRLGFVATTSLFLYFLLVLNYKWWISLVTAVGSSVLMFVFFRILLGVQLPVNGFGW